ncbi:MAG: TIGR02452 family protein [Bacteroidota bacterium]
MSTQAQARIRIIEETLAILQQGTYQNRQGQAVNLGEAQRQAVESSRAWLPEELATLSNQVFEAKTAQTQFEVRNETTFEASLRAHQAGAKHIGALNFASARNPGGGVLRGTKAQEEDLARASGLYPCLAQMEDHFQYHRRHKLGLYSDRMIYSPAVPVFRDAADQLLEDWYPVSIITSAAANVSSLRQNNPERLPDVAAVMRVRTQKVLALAAYHHIDTLILGAWGCGVFKQEPVDMAGYFAELLIEGAFKNVFPKVIFAVLDRTPEERFVAPFRERFGR